MTAKITIRSATGKPRVLAVRTNTVLIHVRDGEVTAVEYRDYERKE